MSDHEFEKQVRQKLDDLKLKPSAPAWEKIEERLRGDRRRRRTPFIWLSLALIGLLSLGGYFLFSPSGPTNTNTLAIADKTMPSAPTASGSPVTSAATPEVSVPAGDSDGPVSLQDQPSSLQTPTQQSYAYEQNTTQKTESTLAEPKTENAFGRTIQKTTRISVDHQSRQKRKTITGRKNTIQRQQITTTDRYPDKLNHGYGEAGKNDQRTDPETDITITSEEKNNTIEKDVIADTATAKNTRGKKAKKMTLQYSKEDSSSVAASSAPVKKKKIKKWSFAVTGYAGVASVHEGGGLKFANPSVEDVSFTPNFAFQPSNVITYQPSPITPGIGYSGGVVVKRELSRRFALSTGINYLQFNTRSKVGQHINSSQVVNNGSRGYLYVQGYYMVEERESKEYKNRYHFLEIPVTLHTRLNNNETLPIYFNTGISVSQLLKSTSLHFDGTTGVYYKDDGLLNRTQLGAVAGLSFALFNKTSRPMWIGPSARYNVSRLLQKDVSANKHFVSLGLDVKWWLK